MFADRRATPEEAAAAAAFVHKVLFKRWSEYGTGPDTYSCWGLARAAQDELAGIALPLIGTNPHDTLAVVRAIQESPLRADWLEVGGPGHLDLVTMSHSRRSHHIGTYLDLDGGGILHAAQQFDAKQRFAPDRPAVNFTALHALPMEGWARLTFMRHRKWVL